MSNLATKNLEKHFDGVYAVNKLSLDFQPGKITGIIGPNGSGKSTLVNALTGLLPIDGGEIIIAGTTHLSRIRTHEVPTFGLTRTFQDVRLFEQMPVLDNILVVLTERGIVSSLLEKHSKFHLEKTEEGSQKSAFGKRRMSLRPIFPTDSESSSRLRGYSPRSIAEPAISILYFLTNHMQVCFRR